MADAKKTENKGQAAGPDDVKKATATAAQKADDAAKASDAADKKAGAAKKDADKAEDESRLENDGAPALLSDKEARERAYLPSEKKGDDAPGSVDRDVTTAAKEDPDKHEPGGRKYGASAPKGKPVFRDGQNTRDAIQKSAEEELNRKQALSGETFAKDPEPHPQASATANLVDLPGRAHTLHGQPLSVGQQLALLVEEARVEGSDSKFDYSKLPGNYDLEEELNAQWPGISLGDDVAAEEASDAKAK
jgi:hypothetical protein